MGTAGSLATLVPIYETTRNDIPEDCSLKIYQATIWFIFNLIQFQVIMFKIYNSSVLLRIIL
jgi:hypothetical protein